MTKEPTPFSTRMWETRPASGRSEQKRPAAQLACGPDTRTCGRHFTAGMVASPVTAKEGKVQILAEFHDFRGWDLHAVWDATKLASTPCRSVEHVALNKSTR